jgi:oxygen-independent coproporphyrinogen-3 oxidase
MKPLSLYIHWPFCKSKCPYCDFNSHVRATLDESGWQKALLAELEWAVDQVSKDHILTSIFFGGGTPSLMAPSTVNSVIDKALTLWPSGSALEITMEANPNSIEAQRFREFKVAGINRISVGIQALNDPDLKALGRQHSAEEAVEAIKIATSIFDRASFDLIYARPGQTLEAWKSELAIALSFGTEHLSLYQLTIEPGTAFAALHARGDLVLPAEDLQADMYELTQEMTIAADLPPYEVSNHARPAAECRHNIAYWAYDEFIGIGPGAHSRFVKDVWKAVKKIRSPELWQKSVQLYGHGTDGEEIIVSHDVRREKLLMGLRLTSGLEIKGLIDDLSILTPLLQEGYITYDQRTGVLKTTLAGRLRLNSIISYLEGHLI